MDAVDERPGKWEEVLARFGGLPMREILLGLIDSRDSLTQVAESLGVTRPTLYYWLSKESLRAESGQRVEAVDMRTGKPQKPSAEAQKVVRDVLEQAENDIEKGDG